jgi:hypothetical protein
MFDYKKSIQQLFAIELNVTVPVVDIINYSIGRLYASASIKR